MNKYITERVFAISSQIHTSIFLCTVQLLSGCAGIRNIRLQKMRLMSASGFKPGADTRTLISNNCEARTSDQFKPLHLFGIVITALLVILLPCQSQAATAHSKHASQSGEKERLVLMPLRVSSEDKELAGAMETALVQSLQQKYAVFSGEQVSQKAHQIFMKETRNPARTECDETRCMQNIAEAFQAELIATANVTKQEGNYFLALSIQNFFDNKVVDSRSETCENCKATQVIAMLKVLSGKGEVAERKQTALTVKPAPSPVAPLASDVHPAKAPVQVVQKVTSNASGSNIHAAQSTKNASPLGYELGVVTRAQIKQQAGSVTTLTDMGVSPYSGGRILEGNGEGLGVDGLSKISFIFDASDKLVAVLMKIPSGGGTFSEMLKALSAKYKLVSKDEPFVGDAYAEFQQGDSVIDVSAIHMEFYAKTVNYMMKLYKATFTQMTNQEQAAKEKRQASKF